MHFTALRRFGFFIALPHTVSNQKNIAGLTWDGKYEKFSVLLSLTQAQRGYSGFQVTGMIEWGAKIKTQKNPLGIKKPKKNHWTKIYPPKNPMPNFRAIMKISRKHKMI